MCFMDEFTSCIVQLNIALDGENNKEGLAC